MNSEEIQRKILELKQEQIKLLEGRKYGCRGKVNLERNNYDEPSTDNLVIERTDRGFGIFASSYDNSKYKRLRR